MIKIQKKRTNTVKLTGKKIFKKTKTKKKSLKQAVDKRGKSAFLLKLAVAKNIYFI